MKNKLTNKQKPNTTTDQPTNRTNWTSYTKIYRNWTRLQVCEWKWEGALLMKRLVLRGWGWGKSGGQGSEEKGRGKGKAQKKVCSRLNIIQVKWNCKRLAEINLQVSMMQTGHTQQTNLDLITEEQEHWITPKKN